MVSAAAEDMAVGLGWERQCGLEKNGEVKNIRHFEMVVGNRGTGFTKSLVGEKLVY